MQNLKLNLPIGGSHKTWKLKAKAQLRARIQEQWSATLSSHPSLWLYHMHCTKLRAPAHASMRGFVGREELTRGRIADIDIYGKYLVDIQGPGRGCPNCAQVAPPAYAASQYRYELLHHLVLGCDHADTQAKVRLLVDQGHLPTTWYQEPWHAQLAIFLQLKDPSSNESIVATAAYLHFALRESKRKARKLNKSRAKMLRRQQRRQSLA